VIYHWVGQLEPANTVYYDTLLGQARCQLLADLTGLEERAIWQWGCMERVSTGLYLMQIGLTRLGRESLAVANIWATTNVRWRI
jgi:streptomycin 6-kinase